MSRTTIYAPPAAGNSQLAPCHSCGAPALLKENSAEDWIMIECGAAEGGGCEITCFLTGKVVEKRHLIEIWNRRAPLQRAIGNRQ